MTIDSIPSVKVEKKEPYSPIRHCWGPLMLVCFCPAMAFLFCYTNVMLHGSLSALTKKVMEEGPVLFAKSAWIPYCFGTWTAWKILFTFSTLQIILLRFLPGQTITGLPTPKGNIPIYQENGVSSFLITMALFVLGGFTLYPLTILYDNFIGLIGALNIFSLCFCLLLYFKGRFYPSSSDSGFSGNFIFDYYWGTELYPRVLGFDIKRWTNSRMGMMSWGLLILSYGAKQHELYGLSDSMVVSIILQLVYITKFFIWEGGYLRSLDIMHDRAGFMICWGCLVWVPSIYTSPALYLVHHPNQLGPFLSVLILFLGCAAILINYWADHQKQNVRATQGSCIIWGKKPVITTANYTDHKGEKKSSILLASGFWGVARHFHYVPEILGAFFWTVPALFVNTSPYFYVTFLMILLVDRSTRDDERCAMKYGVDWKTYCKQVPYKLIPGIF